jgi:Terminase small subunit
MRRARKSNGTPVLTAKEEAFIGLYIRDSNALKAARDAGYKSPQKDSFQLMHRRHVVAEIERRQKVLREREDFDLAKLLDWSVYCATFDIGEIFKNGSFEILPPHKWPDPRLRRLAESVKTTTTISPRGERKIVAEVKFGSRNPHFDRLGLLMGMRKKFDIKIDEGARSIPLAVIDAITTRFDLRLAESELPHEPRKFTIAEFDTANSGEDGTKGER